MSLGQKPTKVAMAFCPNASIAKQVFPQVQQLLGEEYLVIPIPVDMTAPVQEIRRVLDYTVRPQVVLFLALEATQVPAALAGILQAEGLLVLIGTLAQQSGGLHIGSFQQVSGVQLVTTHWVGAGASS